MQPARAYHDCLYDCRAKVTVFRTSCFSVSKIPALCSAGAYRLYVKLGLFFLMFLTEYLTLTMRGEYRSLGIYSCTIGEGRAANKSPH
jgi:hypothetical protein